MPHDPPDDDLRPPAQSRSPTTQNLTPPSQKPSAEPPSTEKRNPDFGLKPYAERPPKKRKPPKKKPKPPPEEPEKDPPGNQGLFVQLWTSGLYDRVEDAYYAAGYGGTADKARTLASKLGAQIRREFSRLAAERARLVAVDQETLLTHTAAVATHDVADLLHDVGGKLQLRPWDTIPEQAKRAIQKIKTKTNADGSVYVEIAYYDKLKALGMVKEWLYPEGKLLPEEYESDLDDGKTIIQVIDNGRMNMDQEQEK